MKTLVAATDFSAISLNAVNYAADMACVAGTDLSIVHVCLVPMAFSEVPAPVYSNGDIIAEAKEKIDQLREKISTRTGGRIKINTVVRTGKIVSEINDYCSTLDTYAVLMGAESIGGLKRFLFGSKAMEAVKQFIWPLIVVPPEVKFTSIRQIGLASDLRNVTDTIPLKELKELVQVFDAKLHVLHVRPESDDVLSEETAEELGWLQDSIGELKPSFHFIREEGVEKGIREFAEKNKIDLLRVVPKKHNLLSKIFRHSYSKNLVLHSRLPVMAIHE